MKKIVFTYFTLLSFVFSVEISIAVAANVSYAIKPLVEAFHVTHPKTKVTVILGSSGKLTAQIMHGAPYDVFMSADMKFPKRLHEEHLTAGSPVVYAQGALAILSQKKRNYCAEIFVLKSPDIHKIAIANPKTAPYGVASIEALKHARLYNTLKKKFVYGESIAQTFIYATSAADIGIVAKSALYAPQMKEYKEAIHWSEVDETLYTPISQGMVLLKRAKANIEAKAFYDFMLSSNAKEILKEFGYKTL